MSRALILLALVVCATGARAQTTPSPLPPVTVTIVYQTDSFRQGLFEHSLLTYFNLPITCQIRFTSNVTSISVAAGLPGLSEVSFEFIGPGAQQYSDNIHRTIRNGNTQQLINHLQASGIILTQLTDTPTRTTTGAPGTTQKTIPAFIIAVCVGLAVLVMILIVCLVLRRQHNERMKLQDKMEVMMDAADAQAHAVQGHCADTNLSPPPPFKATPGQIARLERFYKKYAPEKLKATTAESILRTFGGDEDELYRQLTTKYGPEPKE